MTASVAGGPLLWLRSATVAAVCVAAGTLAHVSADGRLPGGLALAALGTGLLAGGTAGSAVFLRRPATAPRLVALVVLGQAAVHLALTAVGGHGDDPHEGSGHGHGLAAGAAEAVHHLTEDLTGAHAAMALGHAAAAAAVGLWLAVGERALWSLLLVVVDALLPRGVQPLPAGPPRAPVPAATSLPVPLGRLASVVRRRGPPCAATEPTTPSPSRKDPCTTPPIPLGTVMAAPSRLLPSCC